MIDISKYTVVANISNDPIINLKRKAVMRSMEWNDELKFWRIIILVIYYYDMDGEYGEQVSASRIRPYEKIISADMNTDVFVNPETGVMYADMEAYIAAGGDPGIVIIMPEYQYYNMMATTENVVVDVIKNVIINADSKGHFDI